MSISTVRVQHQASQAELILFLFVIPGEDNFIILAVVVYLHY